MNDFIKFLVVCYNRRGLVTWGQYEIAMKLLRKENKLILTHLQCFFPQDLNVAPPHLEKRLLWSTTSPSFIIFLSLS